MGCRYITHPFIRGDYGKPHGGCAIVRLNMQTVTMVGLHIQDREYLSTTTLIGLIGLNFVSANLTFHSADTFILRADHTTVLDPAGAGKNSVRLSSKNTYSTHVAVFDIAHMPQGCGTWPAVWETGGVWPAGVSILLPVATYLPLLILYDQGETDILEGVNDQGSDQSTLHTSPGLQNSAIRRLRPDNSAVLGSNIKPLPSWKSNRIGGHGVRPCNDTNHGPVASGIRLNVQHDRTVSGASRQPGWEPRR
ncbi:hypothetical protein B0H19DRAFT_1241464 [Mycena capillaripes]|nr:hypothetical protein B0H19DRAFT_1241464 [Mycena capillaripes]